MADSNPIRQLESQNSDSNSVRCEGCGTFFQCGMNGADEPCWCAALPQVMPLPRQNAGCYCPDCLATLVEPGTNGR
jgi:hypothetical protein